MGFSQKVADEVLVRCGRHCCLCGMYAGTKIELHHIIQVADGGEDTVDNCIPLCLNCHAEVKAYNPHHPKGRKFTEAELRGHRDKCYAQHAISVSTNSSMEDAEQSEDMWFAKCDATQPPMLIWGFPSIDEMCPLSPGSMGLIAGYTESGKSIYVQQIMLRNIAESNKVLYFHLKESGDALFHNIIAAETRINPWYIRKGELTAGNWQRISAAIGTMNLDCLKLIPFSVHPPIAEQILTAAEKSNADLIIIDDINALGFRDNASIKSFLYYLKGIAAQTGVIVLILNNVQRVNRRPVKRDIQYEALYRMCDIVQFLYREEEDCYGFRDTCPIEIIVAKNYGTSETGTIKMEIVTDVPIIYSVSDNRR